MSRLKLIKNMKTIFTIPTLLLLFISSISAQIDQVSVGASYNQQAYYSLSTGESVVITNDAWDIAFSTSGQQDAGVFFNESASLSNPALQVFLADTEDWTSPITDTDSFTDEVALQNPEANWTEGAMNSIKDPSSPFDYGWGAYNPQNHTIEGAKIFVIKKRDGSFIKFRVESLSGGIYTMQFADLDGTNEVSFQIDKNESIGALAYYSFESQDVVDMPTDYDLIFQRYTTPLDAGDGTFLEYTVTGVLLAPGVQAVVADGIDPSSVSESDYADQYSSLPTTIGHTWKVFDFSAGWIIDEDRTHFIKDRNGDTYQLTFYDFEGSGTGTTTMERNLITSVATSEVPFVDQYLSVFPNPSTAYFVIDMEYDTELKVMIMDNYGRHIRSLNTMSNTPVSVAELSEGIYNISIQGEDFVTVNRLMIK